MQGAELSEGLAGDGELTSLQPSSSPLPKTFPVSCCPQDASLCVSRSGSGAKLLLKQLQKKGKRTNGQLVLVLWLSYGRVCRYCRGEQAVGYDTPNVRKSYCTWQTINSGADGAPAKHSIIYVRVLESVALSRTTLKGTPLILQASRTLRFF